MLTSSRGKPIVKIFRKKLFRIAPYAHHAVTLDVARILSFTRHQPYLTECSLVNQENVAGIGFKFMESISRFFVDKHEIVVVKPAAIDVDAAKHRNSRLHVLVRHECFAKGSYLR